MKKPKLQIEKALDAVEQAASLYAAQKAWDRCHSEMIHAVETAGDMFIPNPYRNSGGVEASSEDTRKDQPNVSEPDLQAVTTPAAVSSEKPAKEALAVLAASMLGWHCYDLSLKETPKLRTELEYPCLSYAGDYRSQTYATSRDLAGQPWAPLLIRDQAMEVARHAVRIHGAISFTMYLTALLRTEDYDPTDWDLINASNEDLVRAALLTTAGASAISASCGNKSGPVPPNEEPRVDSATPTLNENESPKRNPSVQQALGNRP
jgi:hypothetical protein